MGYKYSILLDDTDRLLEEGNFKQCRPKVGEPYMDSSFRYEIVRVDHIGRRVWVKREEMRP